MTSRKRKAATPPLDHWVALSGIEQGQWRVEAGESLSEAPDDLDVEWLLGAGRIVEAGSG